MEAKRLKLHDILCEIMNITEPDGDRHVYFRPPSSVHMKYPAIKYDWRRIDNSHANNAVYMQTHSFEVIVIDRDPDSVYADKLSKLPRCVFDRPYVSDNLNHFVFTISI